MKIKNIFALLHVIVFASLLSSCISTKKINYFENKDQVDLALSKHLFDAKIMPKDILQIQVFSMTPEADSTENRPCVFGEHSRERTGNPHVAMTAHMAHSHSAWPVTHNGGRQIQRGPGPLPRCPSAASQDRMMRRQHTMVPQAGGMLPSCYRSSLSL